MILFIFWYLIEPKLDDNLFKGKEQINVVKQILIIIYVLTTSNLFRSISERFNRPFYLDQVYVLLRA